MTVKEAEHELIELGFVYNPDCGSWDYLRQGSNPSLLDAFLVEHPDTAIQWIREELKARVVTK